MEQRQGDLLQGTLHRGETVSVGDLKQTHRILVGHRHMLLLGADSYAEHPGEALWGGDAERLLGQGQRVDEHRAGGQPAEQQPLVLSYLQAADLSRDRITLRQRTCGEIQGGSESPPVEGALQTLTHTCFYYFNSN